MKFAPPVADWATEEFTLISDVPGCGGRPQRSVCVMDGFCLNGSARPSVWAVLAERRSPHPSPATPAGPVTPPVAVSCSSAGGPHTGLQSPPAGRRGAVFEPAVPCVCQSSWNATRLLLQCPVFKRRRDPYPTGSFCTNMFAFLINVDHSPVICRLSGRSDILIIIFPHDLPFCLLFLECLHSFTYYFSSFNVTFQFPCPPQVPSVRAFSHTISVFRRASSRLLLSPCL